MTESVFYISSNPDGSLQIMGPRGKVFAPVPSESEAKSIVRLLRRGPVPTGIVAKVSSGTFDVLLGGNLVGSFSSVSEASRSYKLAAMNSKRKTVERNIKKVSDRFYVKVDIGGRRAFEGSYLDLQTAREARDAFLSGMPTPPSSPKPPRSPSDRYITKTRSSYSVLIQKKGKTLFCKSYPDIDSARQARDQFLEGKLPYTPRTSGKEPFIYSSGSSYIVKIQRKYGPSFRRSYQDFETAVRVRDAFLMGKDVSSISVPKKRVNSLSENNLNCYIHCRGLQFVVQINILGESVFSGVYDTVEEARGARDEFLKQRGTSFSDLRQKNTLACARV